LTRSRYRSSYKKTR